MPRTRTLISIAVSAAAAATAGARLSIDHGDWPGTAAGALIGLFAGAVAFLVMGAFHRTS